MADAFPDRSAIVSTQLAHLRTLIGALIPANPFYSRKLAGTGITANIASLEEFSRSAPFTIKQDVVGDQEARPPYGTNLTFPVERYTRFHQTSGTTGAPIRWLDTLETWNAMTDCWVEVFRAAEVTPADRVLFAFSFGPFLGFWLAFDAAHRLGCLCIPGGGLSSAARLRAMIDNEATVLCCTPTYAARLAEVAAEEGIDLATTRVKTIVVAGEAGGSVPATRARLEWLWNGARIFDHHGMTEVGPVTFECPRQPGVLHVIESSYYTEIVEPGTGKPTEPGQTGELVLTTLRRTGSPLLRYRTGDLVRSPSRPPPSAAQPCLCGRHSLALEGGILGRVDDMVVVRGVNIFPSAVEDVIRRNGVTEYEVSLDRTGSSTELSLRVEPAPDCADAAGLAKRLEKAFQDAFALRVPVAHVPPGTLPRSEMKARRWVRQP